MHNNRQGQAAYVYGLGLLGKTSPISRGPKGTVINHGIGTRSAWRKPDRQNVYRGSGDWVFRALHKFGFASSPDSQHRDDGMIIKNAYITGALRCAPPQNKPTTAELANCQSYLLQEIHLLSNVKTVIAFGKIGFDTYLRALKELNIYPKAPPAKFGHNLKYDLSNETTLIGSYHPSQQNTQTGRLTEDMFDDVFRTALDYLS